ncbi:hypothetical protein D083_0069 [Dickeya solani RNS 08.23.3.1.A]|nr:hypothetical protein D083_0069 [Dickeya solani RNS 08.23.3.1.A]
MQSLAYSLIFIWIYGITAEYLFLQKHHCYRMVNKKLNNIKPKYGITTKTYFI